jgi:hypothetical protein
MTAGTEATGQVRVSTRLAILRPDVAQSTLMLCASPSPRIQSRHPASLHTLALDDAIAGAVTEYAQNETPPVTEGRMNWIS